MDRNGIEVPRESFRNPHLIRPHVLAAVIALAGAARAEDPPEVVRVCVVAPDVLSIHVRAGSVERGQQRPYVAQPGDTVDRTSVHRFVTRRGAAIGALAGKDEKVLFTFDHVSGERLDAGWADAPESYRVGLADGTGGAKPVAVYRKTRPWNLARTAPWDFTPVLEHFLYLRLPRPLEPGKTYEVTFARGRLAPQKFAWDPASLRSEAVHVNQLGWRPDDPGKVAFLSCWAGSGGGLEYAEGTPFRVLDHATGRTVIEGKARLARASEEVEDAHKKNYSRADVHILDLSGLKTPGTYRVAVEGVGCSWPFEIADDAWRKAFTVSARGFYHQRSGIELGPPFTTFRRPRPFHADDGLSVFESTTPILETGNGLVQGDDNFSRLVKGRTARRVKDAWGGYMDAGDWDRRIQHLDATRLLLELAELFPDYFAPLSLNIPESGGKLPDIVDEALFNLDCYRRMQLPDGGIRGGIESEEHPRFGEASWQESLAVMAYAPDVWSSYLYAGVAARAAAWLRARAPELAKKYEETALRAMAWAEKAMATRKGDPHPVADARNLAAAELFRLTGDAKWGRLFLDTTVFKDPEVAVSVWEKHDQRHGAWVYARTNGADAGMAANCRRAILREADERIASCERTGFRFAKDPWRPIGGGLPSGPDAVGLARAHVLTGEAKYLRAAVLACQFGAGANPLNLCFTTGLGQAYPKNPLNVDSLVSGQAPPPGLTLLGPCDLELARAAAGWAQKFVEPHLTPKPEDWPALEMFFDVLWHPLMCEYTIHEPMAANAYVWGYLAARK